MKSIEISTAHNIVVTNELASVIQRIIAWLIDIILLGIYSAVIASIFGGVSVMMYLLVSLVVAFYHLVMEIFNEGQSVGKMVLKLRVVSIQGMAPSLQDSFLRWIFRLIDIPLTLGSLGMLSILTSTKSQRIGDLLARTTVISLLSRRQVDLESIRNLDRDDAKIVYPSIVRYSDKDMLLIKQTLARYHQSPTASNTDLVLALRDRIAQDLAIEPKEKRASKFLTQILSDYILLKR